MNRVHYTASEERLNVITHFLGIPLSLIGWIFLFIKAENVYEAFGVSIFGLSLLLLYLASTLYHAAKDRSLRAKLRILDHAAIYILIAGTYTPVCLITLKESMGTLLLILIWSIAAIGVFLKLFYTGRFNKLSTLMYVLMGWVAVIAINPLMNFMSSEELFWLFSGGGLYTLGALLYSIRSLTFNHAIFHLFVLGGSFCHYIMIYSTVLN